MGALLESLHALQTLESELQELRQRIARKRRQTLAQTRRLEVFSDELAAKQDALKHRQAEAAEQDLETKVFEDEVSKLRGALNRAKTNKEYSAILTQINTAKANSAKNEGKSLTLIEEIDRIEKEIAELTKKHDAEAAKLAELRDASQAFENETSDALATLQRKHDEAAEAIPASVRTVFERVAGGYDGEAMAQVVQLHPKRLEFSCSGCHMGVRLEQVNALKSRDEIQCCNVCGRILYLEGPATRAVT